LLSDEWVESKNLVIGDVLSDKTIINIEPDSEEHVFDIFDVDETNSYISNGVVSHNCSLLVIDEAAIIPNNIADDFFAAVYPVIFAGKNTKIIMTSTPLGYNHFWKFWTEAEQGKNGFVPVRVDYWEHPNRDEKWSEEQKKLLGEVKYNQEVRCEFLGSSNTLLSGDALSRLSALEPIYSHNNLTLYEKPTVGHTYFIVVDVARGVGNDYSAFSLIDVTQHPYKLIGKYRDNTVSPLLFPSFIAKVGLEYNSAFILIETNDIGQQIADILHEDIEYENLIWVGTKGKAGQYITFGGSGSNIGVRTTKQVKRIGCLNLKTMIEENKLLIFDPDVIFEFSTFIEKRGSFEADEGYHDDLVMTLVLFAWAAQDQVFRDLVNADTRRAIFEARMREIEDELLPLGFYNDGIEDAIEDVSWLIKG
jgi:hypothetical protein